MALLLNMYPDRTPERVVEEAQKLLGIGENPPGSNCNAITARFGLGCVAWCDETWWTALYNAGFNVGGKIDMPGVQTDYALGDAYVPSTMRHFQTAGRFTISPMPGTGEIHFWGGPESNSHIAIYVKDYGDGTHLNIEGNHNNVCEYVRRRNDDPTIQGYCIPVYVVQPQGDDMFDQPDRDVLTEMHGWLRTDLGATHVAAVQAGQKVDQLRDELNVVKAEVEAIKNKVGA